MQKIVQFVVRAFKTEGGWRGLVEAKGCAPVPVAGSSLAALEEVARLAAQGILFAEAAEACAELSAGPPPFEVEIVVPRESVSLDQVVKQIQDWQAVTFPSTTALSALSHLASEIGEALASLPLTPDELDAAVQNVVNRVIKGAEKAPGKPKHEGADMGFMVIQYLACVGGDPLTELVRKLEENRARKWGAVQADGIVEHQQ